MDHGISNVTIFDDVLRRQIQANIARLIAPAAPPVAGLRQAAVAIIITTDEFGQARFLITRRAPRLGKHAGQWALPGGVIDPDETSEAAARRETFEEIGLSLAEDALLGRLDSYETRSGFVISPFVYWAADTGQLRPNPSEVAFIRHVPLSALSTPGYPVFLPGDVAERPILRMSLGDRHIHAPTAALLYQFREVALSGRYLSVAHFDQPEFARR